MSEVTIGQLKEAAKDMAVLLEEIGFGKYDSVGTMKEALKVLLKHATAIKEIRA